MRSWKEWCGAMMTRSDATQGVLASIQQKLVIATATGRDTARLHLLVHPGPVLQAMTDDRDPVFHWCDRPICGAALTAGWVATERGDQRQPCRTCLARWRQLVDRYLGYAGMEIGRRW